jgi:RNA-binding protein Musashi
MFIGGLNWETNDGSFEDDAPFLLLDSNCVAVKLTLLIWFAAERLRDYFEQFGKVVHCTVMRDPNTGRSRGFAFLTFAESASVNQVMSREHYLDGKAIDPKRAIPRADQQKTEKLFVRSIPPGVTQESFREYFAQFGKVIDSTLMMDRDTRTHRGFGFVTYGACRHVRVSMMAALPSPLPFRYVEKRCR